MDICYVETDKGNPDSCPTCKKKMSKYELKDRANQVHTVRLCWRDSAFNVFPPMTEFYMMVHINPSLILDLIKNKNLKPKD